MKATKFVVLAGGILGILSFFLPLIAVPKVDGKVSAYQIVVGLEVAGDVAKKASANATGESKKQIDEADDTIGKIKGFVIGLFIPTALLLVIGGIAVARKKFQRLGGTGALLIGLIGLAVAALLLAVSKDKEVVAAAGGNAAGAGMYTMFLAAALGTVGGIMALIKPDRG